MTVESATALRARLVLMLACLERAGISPVSMEQVHAFAYFVNVLSPLWNLSPLQGSILKRRKGPFFPDLQAELDYLIGCGAVEVHTLSYTPVKGGARVDATVSIRLERVFDVVRVLNSMPDEVEVGRFIDQLAFVFAEIRPDLQDDAVSFDATYGAPTAPEGRVVDFGDWHESARNYSVPAAQRLQAYAPKDVTLSQAEELVLYMRLLKQRTRAIG